MILVFGACALSIIALAVGTVTERRPLRTGIGTVLPLVLLAIPVLQSIPLPLPLRGALDPKGNALLSETDAREPRFWPLSLDPVSTRENVGRAGAALAVFLIAYHLASGKSRRHLIPRVVAASGIAAVVIALGHRLFGFAEIYGTFATTSRSLLTGPFVNSNHTAEFLELAAFSCLACSLQRNAILNRYGWLTGMLLCAAGAVGTLSRGSIVGLLTGLVFFVFLARFARSEGAAAERPRAWLAWTVLVALLVVVTAGALGAGALVDRFRGSAVASDTRFQVWRDSLSVLRNHPFGIGRGAFESVYPIYRTVDATFPVTFAYVENHPLQLLIDSGWLMFGAIVAGIAVVARHIVRYGRRDRIEAALLAGLLGGVAHSFVDFGLETLGVLLPFVAILGVVLGRSAPPQQGPEPKRRGLQLVAVACATLVFGIATVAHSSDDDFDKLLRGTRNVDQRRALLRRAQDVHPMDYFYVLAFARTEPLKPRDGGRSPRLHALNRAFRLCPRCDSVHSEAARSLWQLGRHTQSLAEWRSAVDLNPAAFDAALDELARSGAKPQELAAVAAFNPRRMIDVAKFISARGDIAGALTALDQADALGAPPDESLLTRGALQVALHQFGAAQVTIAQAQAAGIRDPRLAVLEAKVAISTRARTGVDEAIATLDLAATRYPLDIDVQRARLAIVWENEKWQAADRAIDGFKRALYATYGQSLEANVMAARIRNRLGQWTAAMAEYRTALSQQPGQPSLWVEFAEAAEKVGRESTAREAYMEAARIAPGDAKITEAVRRLDARRVRAPVGVDQAGMGSP
jgi:tetratricopeptide (TPR) repeat protein